MSGGFKTINGKWDLLGHKQMQALLNGRTDPSRILRDNAVTPVLPHLTAKNAFALSQTCKLARSTIKPDRATMIGWILQALSPLPVNTQTGLQDYSTSLITDGFIYRMHQLTRLHHADIMKALPDDIPFLTAIVYRLETGTYPVDQRLPISVQNIDRLMGLSGRNDADMMNINTVSRLMHLKWLLTNTPQQLKARINALIGAGTNWLEAMAGGSSRSSSSSRQAVRQLSQLVLGCLSDAEVKALVTGLCTPDVV